MIGGFSVIHLLVLLLILAVPLAIGAIVFPTTRKSR